MCVCSGAGGRGRSEEFRKQPLGDEKCKLHILIKAILFEMLLIILYLSFLKFIYPKNLIEGMTE